MKTLYLDVFSGLSGDMFIGALLNLGVDFRQLEYGLAKLNLDGYRLEHRRAAKHGIEGVKFDVQLTEPSPPPEDGPDYHAHSHSHAHSHGPGEHAHGHSHGKGGWAILTGDSVHCFGDGVLIASAFVADIRLGLIAALSVLAHEVPHHMGDIVVLRQSSSNRRVALIKVSMAGAVTSQAPLAPTRATIWPGRTSRSKSEITGAASP